MPNKETLQPIDMDTAIAQLADLVAYPSCAFEGYDITPTLECADAVVALVQEAGFTNVELLDVGGRSPTVFASHCPNPDAPTVLLYAHYDIQPVHVVEQDWQSEPYTLTLKEDGRYYARGATDDKAGIVGHLHALKTAGGLDAFDNLNIKICFEGEEECFGTLEDYVASDPDRFMADIYMIFDLGNHEFGTPTLTYCLRGTAAVDVEVHALKHALHSGVYGGPTPDALKALTMMLSSLWDKDGNTAIEGVKSFEWEGAAYPEELFKRDLGMVEGADLMGTGPLSDRILSRPAANIIGLDATPVNQSSNVIVPHAKARVSVRFPHGQSFEEVAAAIESHLTKNAPHGVVVSFPHSSGAPAFVTSEDGPYAKQFMAAQEEAYGVPSQLVGGGASIPLLASLQEVNPAAEFMLYGTSDLEKSNVHAGNESIDPVEFQRTILTEALFFKSVSAPESV